MFDKFKNSVNRNDCQWGKWTKNKWGYELKIQ